MCFYEVSVALLGLLAVIYGLTVVLLQTETEDHWVRRLEVTQHVCFYVLLLLFAVWMILLELVRIGTIRLKPLLP